MPGSLRLTRSVSDSVVVWADGLEPDETQNVSDPESRRLTLGQWVYQLLRERVKSNKEVLQNAIGMTVKELKTRTGFSIEQTNFI